MIRNVVRDKKIVINDIWKTEPYKDDKERFRKVKEFQNKKYRIIEIDYKNNNIIYSHLHEAGTFH